MASFWLLDSARQPIGPFDDEQLRQLAASGRLAPEDLVCDTNGGTWIAAKLARPVYFPRVALRPLPPPAPPAAPPPPHTAATPRPEQSSGVVNPALALLVPIAVDPLAFIAGYAGLFSLTLVLAPVALLIGALALRGLRTKPHARGAGRAWFAVVAGSIGSLCLLVLIVSLS